MPARASRLGPELCTGGHDILGSGSDLEATRRRHAAFCEALDGEDRLGGSAKGVATQAHRGRPRMIRLPDIRQAAGGSRQCRSRPR